MQTSGMQQKLTRAGSAETHQMVAAPRTRNFLRRRLGSTAGFCIGNCKRQIRKICQSATAPAFASPAPHEFRLDPREHSTSNATAYAARRWLPGPGAEDTLQRATGGVRTIPRRHPRTLDSRAAGRHFPAVPLEAPGLARPRSVGEVPRTRPTDAASPQLCLPVAS